MGKLFLEDLAAVRLCGLLGIGQARATRVEAGAGGKKR